MFATRNFIAPAVRASIRPQAIRVPANAQVAFVRARIAAMSTANISKVSDPIIHDHKELHEYYNEIVNNPNDHDHQERYGNQFTWELARHSIAEELVVYPAFEKYLGDEGKRLADGDRKQHHEIKEHLKQFQNMQASHPQYVPKIKELYAILDQHIKEEEKDDLPKLEKALQQDDSAKLGANFQRVKAFIPTRSHPSAGENPYFESLAGLLAAPMDKLADMFRKFPEK